MGALGPIFEVSRRHTRSSDPHHYARTIVSPCTGSTEACPTGLRDINWRLLQSNLFLVEMVRLSRKLYAVCEVDTHYEISSP